MAAVITSTLVYVFEYRYTEQETTLPSWTRRYPGQAGSGKIKDAAILFRCYPTHVTRDVSCTK